MNSTRNKKSATPLLDSLRTMLDFYERSYRRVVKLKMSRALWVEIVNEVFSFHDKFDDFLDGKKIWKIPVDIQDYTKELDRENMWAPQGLEFVLEAIV